MFLIKNRVPVDKKSVKRSAIISVELVLTVMEKQRYHHIQNVTLINTQK